MFKSFQEANEAIDRIEKEYRTSEPKEIIIEGEDRSTPLGRRIDRKDSDEELDDIEERRSSASSLTTDEEGEYDSSSFDETDQDEEDEEIRLIRNQMEEDQLQSLEFEKEFSAFLCENVESRKLDPRRTASLDLVIPGKLMHHDHAREDRNITHFQDSIAFSLLTKKGSRSLMKTMHVPSDSAFASSVLVKMEAQKAEQQELKQLVLGYEQRKEDDDLEGRCIYNIPFSAYRDDQLIDMVRFLLIFSSFIVKELTQVFNRRLHPFKKTGMRNDTYRSAR